MQSIRIPFLLVLIAAVAAMAPSLFQGRIPAETELLREFGPWATLPYRGHPITSGGDSFLAFLPDRLVALQEWQDGRLPLWNPYISGGMPILGQQSANPLDPTIGLLAILPVGFAMGATYTLLLVLAGWGMVLFLRELGIRSSPALALGGVAFSLNPYFLYWMELRVFLAGFAALPFALWAIQRLGTRREGRAIGALALSVGYAALAGTLQTLTIFLIVLALRVLWLLGPSRRPASRRGFLLPVGLGGLAGLAIGALPILAILELLTHSTRIEAGEGYYGESNFLPWRVMALWFTPDVFGWPSFKVSELLPGFHRTVASSSGWGALGIVPLGLVGFAWWRRPGPRADRWFWTLLTVLPILALWLALPFQELLRSLWPTVDQVDLPRGLIVVNLGGAVLAAWGAEALVEARRHGARRRVWVLPWLVFAALGALVVILARLGMETPHSLGHDLLPLALVTAGVLLLEGVPTSGRGYGLVALTAVELLRIHFLFNTFSPPISAYPERPLVREMQERLGPPDYYRFLVPGTVRVFPPNTASVYGLTDVRGYSNLPVARYRTLLECAEGSTWRNKTYVKAPLSPIYRLLAGAYYILYFEGWFNAEGFVPVPATTQSNGLYFREDALPRAFLVHQIFEITGEAQAREVLRHPGFNPVSGAILEAGYPLPLSAPARGPETVSIVSYLPDRVVVHVDASAPGMLILSDVFYPGWNATRNGRSTDVLPANWGLRGVAVDRGKQEIVFWYRPRWLIPGGVAMGLGLILTTVLIVLPRRRRDVELRTP